MKRRQQLLERAEAQLGVAFPAAYRQAVLDGTSFVEVRAWSLFPPMQCVHCVDAGWEALERTAGVVIGRGAGGDPLLFLLRDHSAEMGDEVFQWSHDAGELTRLAASFADILVPDRLDQEASALLQQPARLEIVPPAGDDPAERRAAILVDALIADGQLELATRSSRGGVVAATAALLESDEPPTALAPKLIACWMERADVAEVFLADDELRAVLDARRR